MFVGRLYRPASTGPSQTHRTGSTGLVAGCTAPCAGAVLPDQQPAVLPAGGSNPFCLQPGRGPVPPRLYR